MNRVFFQLLWQGHLPSVPHFLPGSSVTFSGQCQVIRKLVAFVPGPLSLGFCLLRQRIRKFQKRTTETFSSYPKIQSKDSVYTKGRPLWWEVAQGKPFLSQACASKIWLTNLSKYASTLELLMRKETGESNKINLKVKNQTSLTMNNWKVKFLKITFQKYESTGISLIKDV